MKERLWNVHNIFIFRNEELSVKEWISMVHGRLYLYAYCDCKSYGFEEAQKIWKLNGWREFSR